MNFLSSLIFSLVFTVSASAAPQAFSLNLLEGGEVKVQFVAKGVYVAKELNRAQIVEPKISFDKDFGYGLAVAPFLAEGYRDLGNIFCKQFGFPSYRGVDNYVQSNKATFYVFAKSQELADIVFQKPAEAYSATTLICNLNK